MELLTNPKQNYRLDPNTCVYTCVNQTNVQKSDKLMLGTSDTWSTIHLSKQTSKPVYHSVDCLISNQMESENQKRMKNFKGNFH